MLKIYWYSSRPMEVKQSIFKKLMSKVERKGFSKLTDWMIQNGIFTQQGSTKFHGNYPGGLLDHKLNLYELFDYMCNMFNIKLSQESKIILSFGHDLCKIKAYINGYWNPTNNGKGHALYSIDLLEKFIELTDDEKDIIKYHMGYYGTKEFNGRGEYLLKEMTDCYNINKIAKLFYFCDDMVAQFVDKTK